MDIEEHIGEILKDIEKKGMEAVKHYSKKFDDHEGDIEVKKKEIQQVEIPDNDKKVIERVIDRVESKHEKQKRSDELYMENGSLYGLVYRPIERIGIYVPGGKSLLSSLIMCGVPAKVAGVDEVVVTTPPSEGGIDPYVLYTAKALGFQELYKLGGAQAIGSMAYGVGMEKVDKIVGPGSSYVNEAKRQVFGTVGIDSLAGPSEICIIADETAERDLIISDIRAQLEHGDSSSAWLLTTSKELKRKIESEENMDRAKVQLKKDLNRCVEEANEIAPEHLQIDTEAPMDLLDEVQNAGAVYLGSYTPAAAADYFLGVNHVLPTGNSARFGSVLNVSDFMKPVSVANVSRKEFLEERHLGTRLAEIENMEEHKRSLEERE